MSLKDLLHIWKQGGDEEADDAEGEEKKPLMIFPGSRLPATHISPEFVKELTGQTLERRIKIKKIERIDPLKLTIKK